MEAPPKTRPAAALAVAPLGAGPLIVAATGILVVGLTARFVTGYMLIGTINLFVLLAGFTLRHRSRRLHAALMSLAILSDLSLVLVLQIQRHAVQTALAFKLSPLNQAHIFCSTSATALYIPMVLLGIQLYFRDRFHPARTKLTLHRRLGWLTLVFRTLGFFLMFSMLGNH